MLKEDGIENKSGQRLIVLDVFRGMTIFLMIIVNTPGGPGPPYVFLSHADWDGCTLADLVFPSFLFAMGNGMIFAVRKWNGLAGGRVLYLILRRTVLIFVIGFLLSWYCTMSGVPGNIRFTAFADTRIMAVLQRIALCFFIAALLIRYLSLRALIFTALVFLLGYWVILMNYGTHDNAFSAEGNVVGRIDRLILGESHMYRERGLVFDPEGLLSTIPATVNVLIGYLAGYWMTKKEKIKGVATKMALWGILLSAIAIAWNTGFPINKKLWTSSFVLLTSGIDLFVLAFLFYAIEAKGLMTGVKFFTVLGKNPLFIYVFSNLLLILLVWHVRPDVLFIDWINKGIFQKIASGPFGSLLFAFSFTMVCWIVTWFMDKRKIYIRI